MKERDELHLALNSFIGEFMKKIALVLTALFALSSVAFAEDTTTTTTTTTATGETTTAPATEKKAPAKKATKKAHKHAKGETHHDGETEAPKAE